jgi:hypothetical protein
MIKIICDFCERDITDHDRFSIRLDVGRRDILKRKTGNWDLCIPCARDLDTNQLIGDEDAS